MYLSGGGRHILFPDLSFREQQRARGLRFGETLGANLMPMAIPLLLIWTLGVYVAASGDNLVLGLGLVGAVLLAIVASAAAYSRRKRFYSKLVREGRAIDLDDDPVGRGLRAFLFAGDRALKPDNQFGLLDEQALGLLYAESFHPLYRFLDGGVATRELLSLLGDEACPALARDRIIELLSDDASDLLDFLRSDIENWQQIEREYEDSLARINYYTFSGRLDRAINRLEVAAESAPRD